MLAYDVTNWESFQRLDKLKKDIDKYRDKKEVSFLSLILSQVPAIPEVFLYGKELHCFSEEVLAE